MKVKDAMTTNVRLARPDQTIAEAARTMAECDAGALPVGDDDRLVGMLTDRDIAIRATAEGSDPTTTPVGEVYTRDITALAPMDTVTDAMQLMRAGDIRRLPVVESGKALGIVSLGDVSIETTPGSVLADISTASPDR